MEAFLRNLLPHLLPADSTFQVHAFQGKHDLLSKLRDRLRGYAQWLPPAWRLVVVLDRDQDDCQNLKQKLESIASKTGLATRSQAGYSRWQLVNRIVIEELEAWYFGDWDAVRTAYPRVSPNVPRRAPYRNPDAIRGGTWEAFERLMKASGYFKTGLSKTAAARAIAVNFDPLRNRSQSFAAFRDAIIEATA